VLNSRSGSSVIYVSFIARNRPTFRFEAMDNVTGRLQTFPRIFLSSNIGYIQYASTVYSANTALAGRRAQ
jgi:hypothetical protein